MVEEEEMEEKEEVREKSVLEESVSAGVLEDPSPPPSLKYLAEEVSTHNYLIK